MCRILVQSAGLLAGEYVKAVECGLASESDRDGVLATIAAACTKLEALCVHAFTPRDVTQICEFLTEFSLMLSIRAHERQRPVFKCGAKHAKDVRFAVLRQSQSPFARHR
jgi:hypothetical protein